MVDLSPQRRTQAHKRVDDELSAEEKQAREEARSAGIRHLAEVEGRTTQKLKTVMAPGPGPRTGGKKVPGGSVTASSTTASRVGTGPPAKKVKVADQDEETQGKGKKSRAERATYRREVEAAATNDESVIDLPMPLPVAHDA